MAKCRPEVIKLCVEKHMATENILQYLGSGCPCGKVIHTIERLRTLKSRGVK